MKADLPADRRQPLAVGEAAAASMASRRVLGGRGHIPPSRKLRIAGLAWAILAPAIAWAEGQPARPTRRRRRDSAQHGRRRQSGGRRGDNAADADPPDPQARQAAE